MAALPPVGDGKTFTADDLILAQPELLEKGGIDVVDGVIVHVDDGDGILQAVENGFQELRGTLQGLGPFFNPSFQGLVEEPQLAVRLPEPVQRLVAEIDDDEDEDGAARKDETGDQFQGKGEAGEKDEVKQQVAQAEEQDQEPEDPPPETEAGRHHVHGLAYRPQGKDEKEESGQDQDDGNGIDKLHTGCCAVMVTRRRMGLSRGNVPCCGGMPYSPDRCRKISRPEGRESVFFVPPATGLATCGWRAAELWHVLLNLYIYCMEAGWEKQAGMGEIATGPVFSP